MSRRRKIFPAPFEVEVTGLSHDGRGIARVNDKILFVFGALPQETVRVQITKIHSRFQEGTTLEVLKPSLMRVKPACTHFGTCGGCSLQHIAPLQQVELKQAWLQDQLTHQGKVTPVEWLPPLLSESQGYRQKARLAVRYVPQKQSLLVGFREQGNNKIAIIESCETLDPRVGKKIKALRELIDALAAKESIAQIEVAASEEEVALIFRHLQPLSDSDQKALITFCQQNQFSLFLQPSNNESVHKVWPEDGNPYLSYQLPTQNLSFAFHPMDFTQVNAQMNQQMINQALALLDPKSDDIILDLFCGLGNFSLPFAKYANRVVGVEGSVQSVSRAKENAIRNQLTNTEFYACNLEDDFKHMPFAKGNYNKIILDPPRSGAQKIVEEMAYFAPKEILYVSCNSATFVRDAAILVHQHGYRLVKCGVMDMFPQTAHIETMGLFVATKK
ncbi:23S rRNA (uracil(1939)-C(5))-methyltransferase RlmD [Candidatus Berkiella aquae]|uniref:23S rRNA (uracil(1939)-C(5))-methyltransferase RlmD n=1 Tax=Candidatus Berkiella aquae TaxID=295108 RepID=A0A0Q9YU38_9GAMM|nr:23S rRNA (uracil(1939)-C(5))-methyltransferase RlmD [Candidatus Berkiella aquae]MCS5711099.1 23S rRNA (uracil(1939)-C(5))-methyltransferase RlmD [Candidatus Berkiella aquae]